MHMGYICIRLFSSIAPQNTNTIVITLNVYDPQHAVELQMLG